MPGGVSSYNKFKENNNRTTFTIRSPINSLLASYIRRERRHHFPYFSPSPLFKEMRKEKMASGITQESLLLSNELEPICSIATEWVDVIFFHQGSQMFDPLRVQGTWRKDTPGVSIAPNWEPPSPTTTSGCGSRNPRTLLQTPLVRLPYDQSDSQGDETEEDDEIDVYDDNDEEYCPNSSSFSARNMSHYTPTAPAPPSLPPPPSSSVSNYSSSNKMLATSLFSPSSPLTSCNIKSLLSSSKFKLLPKSIQLKLLSHLPPSDQLNCKQDTTNKSLDSILHNEYISASLREWQERLVMGTLHRKRIRSNDHIPHWKERFYEEYWGDTKRQRLNNNTQLFYSSPSYTHQQSLVHNTVFKSLVNGSCDTQTTPPAPLPVQLPLHAYSVHCSSQQISQEHSYCSKKELQPTLTLIVGSSCNCRTAPLLVCKTCHYMYHSICGVVHNKCPSCK